MSNRLPNVDNLCKNPDNHEMHMCELKAGNRNDEVEKLEKNPKYVCGNCGNTASEIGALCAPGPLENK